VSGDEGGGKPPFPTCQLKGVERYKSVALLFAGQEKLLNALLFTSQEGRLAPALS
jgi:hypothetical protein